jgi:uncharacterized protein
VIQDAAGILPVTRCKLLVRLVQRPMRPGAFENISLGLSPIAALVRKGHRLRVAIAGADDGNLERLPAAGDVTLSVAHGGDSYLEVPQLQ